MKNLNDCRIWSFVCLWTRGLSCSKSWSGLTYGCPFETHRSTHVQIALKWFQCSKKVPVKVDPVAPSAKRTRKQIPFMLVDMWYCGSGVLTVNTHASKQPQPRAGRGHTRMPDAHSYLQISRARTHTWIIPYPERGIQCIGKKGVGIVAAVFWAMVMAMLQTGLSCRVWFPDAVLSSECLFL